MVIKWQSDDQTILTSDHHLKEPMACVKLWPGVLLGWCNINTYTARFLVIPMKLICIRNPEKVHGYQLETHYRSCRCNANAAEDIWPDCATMHVCSMMRAHCNAIFCITFGLQCIVLCSIIFQCITLHCSMMRAHCFGAHCIDTHTCSTKQTLNFMLPHPHAPCPDKVRSEFKIDICTLVTLLNWLWHCISCRYTYNTPKIQEAHTMCKRMDGWIGSGYADY